MKRIRFRSEGPPAGLARRQLLGEAVPRLLERALAAAPAPAPAGDEWEIRLGADLLYDAGGLRLLAAALESYAGPAARVEFRLAPDPAALRDYYGLQEDVRPDGTVALPVEARRGTGDGPAETVRVTLPATVTPMPFPRGLAEPSEASTPHALLLPYGGEFDLLFANQIAWPAELRLRVARSPAALARALFRRHPRSFPLRAAFAWREIDPTAEVHPTAVVEGSIVGPGARIGAHCTVRCSVVGPEARLHDGAKVEFSTVGRGSWLMHDLVLYRCHVEDEVFLIHGPYQFSCFHSGSAAFATILMDWLPHGGPFKVPTARGLREYRGRFLGSVYREGSRTLGGTLLAPGRVLPENAWLACDPEQIHRKIDPAAPAREPIPPRARDAVRG